MSSVWFTADLHLAHKNIIAMSGRPFRTVDEMNNTLISRWNARVRLNDLVFVLGDFSFEKHDRHLSLLKGQKVLIKGNHDHEHRYRSAPWSAVHDLYETMVNGHRIVLCHYALRTWNNIGRGAYHFFGHSHGRLKGGNQCTDVGVDCWDFNPVSLDEIKLRMAE